VEDLSSLVAGGLGLTAGESMAATNTVSPIPKGAAPGSESESTTQDDITNTLGPVIPATQIPVGTDPKRMPRKTAPAKLSRTPRHANERPGAGTYDEPSFGAHPGGWGPWRQT
jgi:hypothetical protein